MEYSTGLKKDNALVPIETRGVNHKEHLFKRKRIAIIEFIKTLKACELHHGKGKSQRVYLSSERSVQKLWGTYYLESANDLKVKDSFFRRAFNTKFNIGFSNPAVDECSTYLQLDQKIKLELNVEKRKHLSLSLIHI